MAYDLNTMNSTNARTYLDLATNVNVASGGLFGILLVVTIFVFFMVSFKGAGVDFGIDNILASSLSTTVFSSLLFFLGFVSWYVVMAPFGVFLILMIIKSMQ